MGHSPANPQRRRQHGCVEGSVGAGETSDELGQGITATRLSCWLNWHRHPERIAQQRQIGDGCQAFLARDHHRNQSIGQWIRQGDVTAERQVGTG